MLGVRVSSAAPLEAGRQHGVEVAPGVVESCGGEKRKGALVVRDRRGSMSRRGNMGWILVFCLGFEAVLGNLF